MDDHAPKTSVDYEKVDDYATHEFIESGRVLHPSEVV
jgi:hypothetical protein